MGVYYPEVVDKREFIEKVIRTEEERFHETLSDGLVILAEIDRKRSQAEVRIRSADRMHLSFMIRMAFRLI